MPEPDPSLSPPLPPSLSLYHDVLLASLDRELLPELQSDRARFVAQAMRRVIVRLAGMADALPLPPENLAALVPERAPSSMATALEREYAALNAIDARAQARLATAAATAASEAPATLSAEKLQECLRRHYAPQVQVLDFRVLAGGRSKQTILLTLQGHDDPCTEFVIRRDLIVGVTGGSVAEEYELLKALAELRLPVPRPHLLVSDTSELGGAFMLMDKMAGAKVGDVFDPPPSPQAVLDAARVLARLHQVQVAEIAPTLRSSMQSAPDAQALQGQISELRTLWQTRSRAPSATLDAVFQWLQDGVGGLSPRVTLVHGDYSFHNLMFSGDALSAVLDWELTRIGHPAEDLGYIRTAVKRSMPWGDFMAAYREAGGADIPHHDVVFYTLLVKLRLMALLFGARQYIESGLTDDVQILDATAFHLPWMVYQLAEEMRELHTAGAQA